MQMQVTHMIQEKVSKFIDYMAKKYDYKKK